MVLLSCWWVYGPEAKEPSEAPKEPVPMPWTAPAGKPDITQKKFMHPDWQDTVEQDPLTCEAIWVEKIEMETNTLMMVLLI